MDYPYNKFQYITNLVIDNLEGGYWHPDFYIKGAKRYPDGAFVSANNFVKAGYKDSGETLFGLDRHAGWNNWYRTTRKTDSPQGNLKFIYSNVYQFNDDNALKFWTTLDKLDARNKWDWGYQGGIYNGLL